jgi:hypothetical protein
MNSIMKFIQINLYHSKVAIALLCNKLAMGKSDTVLIQELWIYKGRRRGLNSTGGTIIYFASNSN